MVSCGMFPGNNGEATAVGIVLGVWLGVVEDSIREVDTINLFSKTREMKTSQLSSAVF